jgi:hypothetical protein
MKARKNSKIKCAQLLSLMAMSEQFNTIAIIEINIPYCI